MGRGRETDLVPYPRTSVGLWEPAPRAPEERTALRPLGAPWWITGKGPRPRMKRTRDGTILCVDNYDSFVFTIWATYAT